MQFYRVKSAIKCSHCSVLNLKSVACIKMDRKGDNWFGNRLHMGLCKVFLLVDCVKLRGFALMKFFEEDDDS